MANLVGTAAALTRLPNAADLGQWILIGVGALSSLLAFVFGMLISLRHPRARSAGFAAVAVAVPAAAFCGLLAYVESSRGRPQRGRVPIRDPLTRDRGEGRVSGRRPREGRHRSRARSRNLRSGSSARGGVGWRLTGSTR